MRPASRINIRANTSGFFNWLAIHKNAPEPAEIMGNTVPIIRKHYENTVMDLMAGPYWTIQPN